MPESFQQRAADASARKRKTARLVRDLSTTRPLLSEQRAEVIAAAAAIPVVGDDR